MCWVLYMLGKHRDKVCGIVMGQCKECCGVFDRVIRELCIKLKCCCDVRRD